MSLDLRVPLGILFVVFGAILVYAGATGGADATAKSLGVNINLWWGIFLLVFGAAMYGLAKRRPAGSN